MAHSWLVERDGGGCAGFVSTDRTGGSVAMSEKSLLEVELARLCNRQFFPSPAAWEDQVLYFLILDRFSGLVGGTPAQQQTVLGAVFSHTGSFLRPGGSGADCYGHLVQYQSGTADRTGRRVCHLRIALQTSWEECCLIF